MDRTAAWARPSLPAALPALVAALVGVAGTFGAAMRQPTARPLDMLGVALLLAGPALLLARRGWPSATVLGVLVVLVGYLRLGYPYGPVFITLLFALVSAVIWGARPGVWLVAGVAYLGVVGAVWWRQGSPGWWLVTGAAAWVLLALSAGELVRARLDRRARQRRERAEQAGRRATEERLRIARDLHDVLAHHVSLINVQSSTALHLLDSRPELAREALAAIKASSREVLVELRGMVGVLRGTDEDAPRSPTGLGGLDTLAARLGAVGLPVTVARTGEPHPVPPSVDTAAFRIVQEALTNAHRHAHASRVTVGLDYAERALTVQVDDDGVGPSTAGPDGGNGIPGMRERATALGGELTAGARPGGGFRVRARLPLRRSATEDRS